RVKEGFPVQEEVDLDADGEILRRVEDGPVAVQLAPREDHAQRRAVPQLVRRIPDLSILIEVVVELNGEIPGAVRTVDPLREVELDGIAQKDLGGGAGD